MVMSYDYERAVLPLAPARPEEWDARTSKRLYLQGGRQYCLSYATPLSPVEPVRSYKPPVRSARPSASAEKRPSALRRLGRAVMRRVDTRPEPYGDLPVSVDDQILRIAQRLSKLKEEATQAQRHK